MASLLALRRAPSGFVDKRRVPEARTRVPPCGEPSSSIDLEVGLPVSRCGVLAGLAMVAEQQMNCGSAP